MGKRILNTIKKYHFIPVAIAAIVLQLIRASFDKNDYVNRFILDFLLIVLLVGYIVYILQKIYRAKTGRSYVKDRYHDNMSYPELIRLHKNEDSQLLDMKQFEIQEWKSAEGILFGYGEKGELVKLPSDAEANIFVAGAPGSRKTTGIVLPTCRSYRGSILAVDIKGDIYNNSKGTRKHILRFSPDLSDRYGNSIAVEESCTFNPLAGVRSMSAADRKTFAENMGMILIPTMNEKDTYFCTNARKMFCGFLLFFLDACPKLTFPEFLHAVLHNQIPSSYTLDWFPENYFQLIEYISDSSCSAAKGYVSSMIGNNVKNISGIFDRLCTALNPLTNDVLDKLLVDSDNCINADKLEKGYDVFLQIKQENLAVYAPLFTMILHNFMTAFSRRKDSSTGVKNRPLLIILDEFPQLTFPYESIDSALSTLRSKSVQCMVVCQSLSQLAKRYDTYGYQSLIGNCNYQLCLKANDELTQHHFSELCGTKRTLVHTYSRTDSSTEAREPIYYPSELGDLHDELVLYYNGKHAKIKKIKSYEKGTQQHRNLEF